eukprot:CAMPEP_0182886614 /NCGR_PEP_ID=MMETSP0034_2-20130328/20330_1 /TAXON_ID=156128 /ORGANISM="Nephroselmis pyriformis, Strain CCMP717" /LENGTH=72 /DNA_ID=CAMNT_0025019951 /DNA_START=79 /DNA_END=297 /DNA_ORIENTATION=-
MPSSRAAARERSITRLCAYGPRSLTLTQTRPPPELATTSTNAPRGKVLWAADNTSGSYGSPDAVAFPRRLSA